MKKNRFLTRMTALLLVLVCMLGLLPTAALAADAPSSIKLEDCTHNGVHYESPSLGTCWLHQMTFDYNQKSTIGFCAEHGKGMGWSLEGQTWGNPKPITDPTVQGHSGYADEGSDIICAAVTSAVRLTECAVNDVLGLGASVKVRESDASITMKIPGGLSEANETTCQTLLAALMVHFASLHEEYPDHISVMEEE